MYPKDLELINIVNLKKKFGKFLNRSKSTPIPITSQIHHITGGPPISGVTGPWVGPTDPEKKYKIIWKIKMYEIRKKISKLWGKIEILKYCEKVEIFAKLLKYWEKNRNFGQILKYWHAIFAMAKTKFWYLGNNQK